MAIKSITVLESGNTLVNVMSIIKLYWVPGHCNNSGNESADELARCGSELIDIDVDKSMNI